MSDKNSVMSEKEAHNGNSGWKNLKLSDIISLIGGGTPKRSKSEYWGGEIPWLSVKDFNNDSRYVSSAEESITELGLEKSSTNVLSEGNLIISARGTVGALAQLTKPMAFNQSCYGIDAKLEYTNNDYLYYLVKFSVGNFKQITHGAVFDTITRETFDHIIVDLPPIKKQYIIANILGSLDDKIEINRRINQTLEDMAQAIFKSWFVNFDPVKAKISVLDAGGTEEVANFAAMQVISGKDKDKLSEMNSNSPEKYTELKATAELFPDAMIDSELGEIPEGWEVKALDKIANYQNGLALQKFRPENDSEYLPVVKIAQLKKGYADGEERATVDINPKCIIDDGDIVFSWSGSLMVDIWCGGKAALNQHLFKVTSDKYPKWLYYYYTLHHLAEFQGIAKAKAVTMGHIKREHLSQALCSIPNEELINLGSKLLEECINDSILLKKQNAHFANVRDFLLPKLLSGDIPIVNGIFDGGSE